MKLILPAVLLLVCVCAFVIFKKAEVVIPENSINNKHVIRENENDRLQNYAEKARSYLALKKFNRSYCFLIDMKQSSGRKRFFIYSLTGDSIINSGLVTHGSGSQTESSTLIFSNTANSNATSLGKYKVGQEYNGKFGTAFKLYGLDKTNSNAFARYVVLHSHPLVPAEEISPQHICLSWGCPTVNPDFLKVLKKYINNSNEPVLLYIFY